MPIFGRKWKFLCVACVAVTFLLGPSWIYFGAKINDIKKLHTFRFKNDVIMADPKTGKEVKLAICVWVRNEGAYLSNWIEHHALIGFDSFIIYNDNSSDDTQCVIDAYAESGLVTRIPEDIKEEHLDGVELSHQGVVFNVCRKHLLDLEQKTKDAQWWMLTSDPDEFLWINRKETTHTAKDILHQLLSERPMTQEIRISMLTYGSSARETYSPGLDMNLFLHRFDHGQYLKSIGKVPMQTNPLPLEVFDCPSWGGLIQPFEVLPKAMTMVSAMAESCGDKREHCFTPHCHSLSLESYVHNTEKRFYYSRDTVHDYFIIAHYKVRSREEFYGRICTSQYSTKYYIPNRKKQSHYHGCCSPKGYFDSLNENMYTLDERMLPFANELATSLTNTSAHCKTDYQKSSCPKFLLETTGELGIQALQKWIDYTQHNFTESGSISIKSKEKFKPLLFSAGYGETEKMLEATCFLGLNSVNLYQECCEKFPIIGDDGKFQVSSVPKAGMLAHERLLRAISALRKCLVDDNFPCPSVNTVFTSIQIHIDNVIASTDIDAIHASPYTEFAEYILESTERIRGKKPIVIMSEIEANDWLKSYILTESGYYCRLDMTHDDGIPFGINLYQCLKSAVSKGLGTASIGDILVSIQDKDLGHQKEVQALTSSFRKLQDSLIAISHFDINGSVYNNTVEAEELAGEIKNILESSSGLHLDLPPKNSTHYYRPDQSQRTCMPDYETAIATGRHCNKLIVFLHFHKGGGTSMIEYIHSLGLNTDFRVNSDPLRFKNFSDSEDVFVAFFKNNLRLKNHSTKSLEKNTRPFSPDFWWLLYEKGLDVVNLEYNFILPKSFSNVNSDLWTITMIRNPWDRFRSTFEKELSIRCRKCLSSTCTNLTLACYEKHSLDDWMERGIGILNEQRINNWGGILHSNYYTRMFNGMADLPYIQLNQTHLDEAKRILDSFDLVLILEESEESKMKKLTTFLGQKREDSFPSLSNNVLKDDPMYKSIRRIIDEYKTMFENKNSVDIELYEYAQSLSY